jgi:hypothetical protein
MSQRSNVARRRGQTAVEAAGSRDRRFDDFDLPVVQVGDGGRIPAGHARVVAPARKKNQCCAVLRKTFCHVPGIGFKAEQRLWAAGVVSWDSLDAVGEALGARRREVMVRHVEESQRQLASHNAGFFAELCLGASTGGCIPTSANRWHISISRRRG